MSKLTESRKKFEKYKEDSEKKLANLNEELAKKDAELKKANLEVKELRKKSSNNSQIAMEQMKTQIASIMASYETTLRVENLDSGRQNEGKSKII